MRNRYRSNDHHLALKLLSTDESKIESTSREMEHHQRAAAMSEFVVDMYTWGQIGDDFMFVSMEYCSGGDIQRLIKQGSGIADDALRWKLYMQVCIGVHAIHEADLIHLDLKPANGELSYQECFLL